MARLNEIKNHRIDQVYSIASASFDLLAIASSESLPLSHEHEKITENTIAPARTPAAKIKYF